MLFLLDSLRRFFSTLVFFYFSRPFVLAVANRSLSTDVGPNIFKHAVVQPLLKKSGLDPTDLANFRSISKLPFISKILEKIVCNQIMAFLKDINILEV